MELFQLNKEILIESYSEVNLIYILNGTRVKLSGDNISKYFTKYWKRLIVPMTLNDYTSYIYNQEDIEESYSTWYEKNAKNIELVINVLIQKEFLVKTIENEFRQINQEIRLVLFNPFDLDIGKLIIESFNLYNSHMKFISATIQFEEKSKISEIIEDYDAIIYIMPDSIGFFEGAEILSKGTIIPVVLNNNYFSIGPRIESKNDINFTSMILDRERKRYAYLNYRFLLSCDQIMTSFLNKEIYNLIAEKFNLLSNTQIRDGQIIYNNNSSVLEYKRYEKGFNYE
ncbi:TPA: hypothetical protein TXU88_001434 [Streptococcus suis]|nr:hypothetical protein [Streptococcus suis]